MPSLPTIPEPLAMLARNPFITDLTSDGPIPYVMRQKLTRAPLLPSAESIKGRVVLVTGATGGVGVSAARHFLQLGAVLILGVRDTARGNVVKDQLLQDVAGGSVTVLRLDLASFESVEQFVKDLKVSVTNGNLNIAIMNAAFLSNEKQTTIDGHEMLLQVNVLRRLVVVSSEAHAWVTYSPPEDIMIVDDLDADTTNFPDRYNLTKMLITLWTEAFAQSVDERELEVAMTTPGVCASDLFRDSEGLLLKFISFTSARPVSYGGKTHVHAASVPLTVNGQYFRDGKPTP
ncbi:hypothetical protein MBLNU459_g0811t2 [Dothideomycetes sp. NU459]